MWIAPCSHEGEMYKSLLSDYEKSQKSLMLENAELKKVLQQMKKEMMHILSPRKSTSRGATADDGQEQVLYLLFLTGPLYKRKKEACLDGIDHYM